VRMGTIVERHLYYLPGLRDRYERFLPTIRAVVLHNPEDAICLGTVEGTLAASVVVDGYALKYARGLLRALLDYPGGPPEVYVARTRF
ncbi:MAG TPA: hypothetical protein VJ827_06575, partial [Rubrobacter sp.]|nr:hypothetical protein [Rubrobacter sp.]